MQRKERSFTVDKSSISKTGGRYINKEPRDAAIKAAHFLFDDKKARGQSVITFQLRETTRGSQNKLRAYRAKKNKMIKTVNIAGKNITFTQSVDVKSVPLRPDVTKGGGGEDDEYEEIKTEFVNYANAMVDKSAEGENTAGVISDALDYLNSVKDDGKLTVARDGLGNVDAVLVSGSGLSENLEIFVVYLIYMNDLYQKNASNFEVEFQQNDVTMAAHELIAEHAEEEDNFRDYVRRYLYRLEHDSLNGDVNESTSLVAHFLLALMKNTEYNESAKKLYRLAADHAHYTKIRDMHGEDALVRGYGKSPPPAVPVGRLIVNTGSEFLEIVRYLLSKYDDDGAANDRT